MPYLYGHGQPLHTVAFTKVFEAQAKAEGVSETELVALVDLLSKNPEAGVLIVGSGGCRKVRLAKTGGGKSCGYRVVTYYATSSIPVYAIAVLSKSGRANFSDAEVGAMAKLTSVIADHWAKQRTG